MPTQTVKVNTATFELLSSSASDMNASFVINGTEDYTLVKTAFKNNKGDIVIYYDDVPMQTLKGFTKLVKITDALDNYTVNMTKEYNDSEALEIIVGHEPSVDEAHAIRESVESMATRIPDEDAEKDIWAFPLWDGNSHEYKVDERIAYNGLLYKVVQAHTSQPDWTPDVTPALYARVSDPGEEWPEWIQPTGAQDAYDVGAKVSHNDKHWINTSPANVYEPGVFGWDEVTDEAE